MSYTKKYLGKNEELKKAHDEQEDRIEEGFNKVKDDFVGEKVSLSAINGFEFGNPSAGWNDPVAYRIGNIVYLQGILWKSSGDTNKVAFTLPSGFRPKGTTQVALGGSSVAVATITNNGNFTPNIMGAHCHLNGAFFIV